MTKLNVFLIAVALVCALSVVAAQHKARKLYNELEREQERARQLDVEWGQFQLEAGTWAAHARIERIARQGLHMAAPPAGQVIVVEPAGSK